MDIDNCEHDWIAKEEFDDGSVIPICRKCDLVWNRIGRQFL